MRYALSATGQKIHIGHPAGIGTMCDANGGGKVHVVQWWLDVPSDSWLTGFCQPCVRIARWHGIEVDNPRCIAPAHYPQPEPPNALTADPRLHATDPDTPCEYEEAAR